MLGKSREALLRRVHTFICPVNLAVLKAFIEAEASKMKYKDYLAKFKNDLLNPKSLYENCSGKGGGSGAKKGVEGPFLYRLFKKYWKF